MLLYHFPLISDYSNRGYAKLFDANGNEKPLASLTTGFVSGGKVASNAKGSTTTLGVSYWDKKYNSYSIAIRAYRGNDENNIYGHLIVLHGGSTGKTDLNARFLNGNLKIGYYVTQSQVVITEIDVPVTIGWHDIVLNFNSGTLKCYLDTKFVGSIDSISYGIVPYFFGNNFIGSNISTATLIQDVRIYDRELSQAEINEYSRALVVHYPLQGNELNPSVLKDVSGFGNDLLIDSTTDLTNSIDSPRGLRSISFGKTWFRGNSDRTQLKNGNLKGKTFAWWYKPLNVTNSSTLVGMQFISFTYNSNRVWLSYVFLLNDRNEINNVQGIYFASEDNNWIHCVVVIDDAAEKILFYKNGIYQRELKRESITQTNAKDGLFLGEVSGIFKNPWNWGSPQNIFYSAFSDFRIYATALSAEDIKNLYNSPIAVSKQHQTMAFEFNENTLYPSKYWRTSTYAEMNYILNTRTNAANLRTLGRVEISSGVYRNGLFLLPDGFVVPSGITVTITTANYTTNSYTLAQFKQLESVGVVFMAESGRTGTTVDKTYFLWLGTESDYTGSLGLRMWAWGVLYQNNTIVITRYLSKSCGVSVRLIHNGTHFSTSATTKIDFAPANLQYHCTQHIWRFAQHSYDIIGADNANISDSYNGWIDLFGYGTSGINYSPTLHTTTNSDYASGDIANTDNDWGINEIQSYDYNVKNFSLNKNGIVQHNELRENDSEVNGCYQDKLITNELIEN